jgi:hypothetical protein
LKWMQLQTTLKMWFWMWWVKMGGLTNSDMASEWMCLRCDDDLVFQGIRSRVITQTNEQIAPFLIGVHCVAHWNNLAILVLSKLSLVMHIEGMLQSLYAFFSHSPKKVLEFVNITKTLETKGLKLLWNLKTCWILMLSPLKCVLGEYKSLVVKMHIDAPKNKLARENLDLLCDLELVFG